MAQANLNTADFIEGNGVTQDVNVIRIDGNAMTDFDFNYFNYEFTEPVSYLLFKEGVDENTILSPVGYDINFGAI